MAWPRCPRCGARDLERPDRAEEVCPAAATVFRSYRCACGWSAWSAEVVFAEDVSTVYLRRKFASDFESAPRAVQTPVTSEP